jgi:hypothetical protein
MYLYAELLKISWDDVIRHDIVPRNCELSFAWSIFNQAISWKFGYGRLFTIRKKSYRRSCCTTVPHKGINSYITSSITPLKNVLLSLPGMLADSTVHSLGELLSWLCSYCCLGCLYFKLEVRTRCISFNKKIIVYLLFVMIMIS